MKSFKRFVKEDAGFTDQNTNSLVGSLEVNPSEYPKEIPA